MLTTIEDITFFREMDQAIREICPDVHELQFVEHGSDNIVALVNKTHVFRFPRDERSARRLVFETALFQKIKGKIDVVAVPELIQVHTRPLYIVAQYIPGEHPTEPQIHALSEVEQQAIGSKIASFVHQFNQAITSQEVALLRQQANINSLAEPWPAYFQRLFEQQALPNAQLKPVVEQYYGLWQTYAQQERANYTIHDDLHPSNLLFSGSELTGVVDFGDTNVGSIESELRWLYLMGDTVLKAAIEKYHELSGVTVDYEHVKVWAIMHELSSFTDRFVRQQTETYPFKRAHAHLRQWVPGFPL